MNSWQPIIFILTLTFGLSGRSFAQGLNPEEIAKKSGLKQFVQDNLQKVLSEAQISVSPAVTQQLDEKKNEQFEKLKNPFIPKIPQREIAPLPTAVPTTQSQTKIPAVPGAMKAEPVKPNFDISGIIWNSKRPQAIINNQVFSEGDTLESWTITKINKEGVLVSSQGINFLFLPP